MCACFGMLRPYVVFWNASLWSLSGKAGEAAQPAPSLVNSEVNLHMVELENEGFCGVAVDFWCVWLGLLRDCGDPGPTCLFSFVLLRLLVYGSS